MRTLMRTTGGIPMNANQFFDEGTTRIIENICSTYQLPHAYLFTILLPAIDHHVNNAQVVCTGGVRTNISFYTSIIGYPGSIKSMAVDIIRSACMDVEKLLGIEIDKPYINNSATIESLLNEMKETSCRLFQPWDELNTLISSFGLYRSEKAAYDRSIINTLYNTNQIAGAGHPSEVIESVKNDNEGDGLFGRFLLAAPTPYLPLAEEISDINEDCASLSHFLYIINLLNPAENEYGDPICMVYKYNEAAESIIKGGIIRGFRLIVK
ncbi:unnamed protein product, partial [Didymodactylos carnosus]